MSGGFNRFLFFLFGFFFSSLLIAQPRAQDLIDIQLISDGSVVSPNSELCVGLQISLAPDWHIYWKNAGGSGYPSTLKWKLPQDWKAEPLDFPAPYLYQYEGMTGYALENNFTLLVTLITPPQLKEQVSIQGFFEALICNESTCLPYEYSFSLKMDQSKKLQPTDEQKSVIDHAKSILPQSMPPDVYLHASSNEKGGKLSIQSENFSGFSGEQFSFFPENVSILVEHHEKTFFREKNELEIRWKFIEENEKLPPSIDGILTHPKIASPWILSEPLVISEVPLLTDNDKTPKSEFLLLNILLGFVLIAMAAWGLGRSRQPRAIVRNWHIFACLSLCAGLWLAYPAKTIQPSGSLKWKPWSQQLEDKLLAQGRAVYIDYTAKWCLSCQVNKRVYSDEKVRNAIMESDVHLLRADWTQKSKDILKSLQSHGREGVPFNVYFPPAEKGKPVRPIYLPEILTNTYIVDLLSDGMSPKEIPQQSDHFLTLIGLAWLGGLTLNLMPCVFPVIGLKIMGFVKQAGKDRNQISQHGWAFTFGVLLSFWALVGILLILRDGLEQQLGWGFQLQEPIFVMILAIVLFLFGLSLSGVFEMGMSITGLGTSLTRKSGLWGSFFSGFLATVVATPCMAPFLGVAVGTALTMSALPTFAVFTSIALGLSTPYLLLSSFPAWLEKLPKPGAWMESFKQFMAFPVYATVAWLIWTLEGLLN